MKRTTVVLPDDLAALLEWERRRRGVSAEAIVRDALDAYLIGRRKPLSIVALGRSGYSTTARDAEEILAREWTYDRIMGRDDPAPSGGPPRNGEAPITAEPVATEDGSILVDDTEGNYGSPPERNGLGLGNDPPALGTDAAKGRGRNRS